MQSHLACTAPGGAREKCSKGRKNSKGLLYFLPLPVCHVMEGETSREINAGPAGRKGGQDLAHLSTQGMRRRRGQPVLGSCGNRSGSAQIPARARTRFTSCSSPRAWPHLAVLSATSLTFRSLQGPLSGLDPRGRVSLCCTSQGLCLVCRLSPPMPADRSRAQASGGSGGGCFSVVWSLCI